MKRGLVLLSVSFCFILLSLSLISGLVLRVSDVTPSTVKPNDDFTVSVQIENDEKFNANDIVLVVKSIGEDLQLKEDRSINLGNLGSFGGLKNVVYHFHTAGNAISGERTVQLTLYWKNSDFSFNDTNALYQSDYTFTVNVNADQPKLTVSGVKTDPERIGKKQDIVLTVKVENYGDGTAKNVRVKLNGLDFTGVSDAYLGEINPHEYSPARFVLQSTNEGEHNFTAFVTYEFAGNETQTEIPLSLYVFDGNNYWIWIIPTILIVVFGIYMIARGRRY